MPDALQFTFALPGDWWTIRVDENAERSIKAYVERQVGRDDRLAAHRAELRQHLSEALGQARSGGAIAMYLALELAPGVPLPVTLTTYRPPVPPHLTMEVGPMPASDSFAAWLERSSPESEVGSWSDESVGVVRERKFAIMTGEDGDQVENLRADYWVFVAGSLQPFLMAFSSPVIWAEELEPLAGLFDAIVETVSWHEGADDPSAVTDQPRVDDGAATTVLP